MSLGDNCTVEAGLYVTGGTPVTVKGGDDGVYKARQLSGASGLLFRRNGLTGGVEVLPNSDAAWQGLNAALHSND